MHFDIFQYCKTGVASDRADHIGYAHLYLHDIQKIDWRFEIFRIDEAHIVSLAIGPAGSGEDMIWSTASQPSHVSSEVFPAIEFKSLVELMSQHHKDEYLSLLQL